MFVERLVKVNINENWLKKAYTLWGKDDSSISMVRPLTKKRLLTFDVDTGWSGFIDLQEWFCSTYPKLAVMSASHISDEQLYELFVNHDTQLVLPALPIYKRLQFNKIITMAFMDDEQLLSTQNCFSIATKIGKLWITKLSEKQVTDKTVFSHDSNNIIHNIPLYLKFVLGQSKLSLSLFKRIKTGDILLIQEKTHIISVNNQIIGNYKMGDEGIMVNLHDINLIKQETLDNAPSDLQKKMSDVYENDPTEQNEAIATKISYKNIVPIKLSFVLDHKKIKLSELEALSEGYLLELSQNCYKSVEIEANGMPIAKGEVVVVDENMAVEIKTIYGEH